MAFICHPAWIDISAVKLNSGYNLKPAYYFKIVPEFDKASEYAQHCTVRIHDCLKMLKLHGCWKQLFFFNSHFNYLCVIVWDFLPNNVSSWRQGVKIIQWLPATFSDFYGQCLYKPCLCLNEKRLSLPYKCKWSQRLPLFCAISSLATVKAK